MGKFRTKIKGQAKGKRWRKGQSASSNPCIRKYRDQVKTIFLYDPKATNTLTSDALKKHNAMQELQVLDHNSTMTDSQFDAESIDSSQSFTSIQSFASVWSACTNMSYNNFLNKFVPTSELHKNMLAILAAVTECIKDNGGTESSTEYYCTLNTTLEQMMSSESINENQLTALLSLLSMGIKSVPHSVLRTSFDKISNNLMLILEKFSMSENSILIISSLKIFTVLFKTLEQSLWLHSNIQTKFITLLNLFTLHTKSKWRRAGQGSIAAIISSEYLKNDSTNLAALKVAQFCDDKINEFLGNNEILLTSLQTSLTTVLHVLNFMKSIIIYFPPDYIKTSCETILRLMSLNDAKVTISGLQVLHALFCNSQKVIMSAEMNGQIIAALYDYRPSIVDVQVIIAWLTVIQQAFVHLADADILSACISLPTVFTRIIDIWLSQNQQIINATTQTIKVILQDIVGPICADIKIIEQHRTKLQKCFQIIESTISYQYNSIWPQILHVISVMFDVAGRNCSSMFTNCLNILVDIRESEHFSHNIELEHAFGAAIRTMGPEVVLSVISLKTENDEFNVNRSWIIQVLNQNVRNSSLEFWIKNILPLAILCHTRANELETKNDKVGSHVNGLLHFQLWNLLPKFCNNASDIAQSFKTVAKVLGVNLIKYKDLRLCIMSGLRKLIISAKNAENTSDLDELARFDKNFLPILFNIYTTKASGTDEEGFRRAALITASLYLKIAKDELIEELFRNAVQRFEKANETHDKFTSTSILGILRILLPYQSYENVEHLYKNCIISEIDEKTGEKQRQAYLLFEVLCHSDAIHCQNFLKVNKNNIQEILLKSSKTASKNSKSSRLRCFRHLLDDDFNTELNKKVTFNVAINEAIIACNCKSNLRKSAAFAYLSKLLEKCETNNNLDIYFQSILKHLKSKNKSSITSACLVAIAFSIKTLGMSIGKDLLSTVLKRAFEIIRTTSNKNVADSGMTLVKVFCTNCPILMVGTELINIIKVISQLKTDCKQHVRLKVRYILEKLICKFDADSIQKLIPENDIVMLKQIRNVRKLISKAKRLKDNERSIQSNDSEDEFLVTTKPNTIDEILADSDDNISVSTDAEGTNGKTKAKKKIDQNVWIMEDDELPIDLMDSLASTKISVTKPSTLTQNPKNLDKNRGFKTAPDGRLIIKDSDDDSDSDIPIKKEETAVVSDEEVDDSINKAATEILRNRKRKRSTCGSIYSQPRSKYAPGGSGIHRNVARSSKSSVSASSIIIGSEYKAKKAGGDQKRKGKLDPYAYLPLKRSNLNKRKQLKNKVAFQAIVKAGKTNAEKRLKDRKKIRKTDFN